MDTNTPQSVTPRVSILIPNYNNGRQSSASGKRDFIRDLLISLESTLTNDPTPFEILVFDDGSNDDSIETLREWDKNKTWASDGRSFFTLFEEPHCGILSITANKLSKAARGEILVRLDGDIVCLTPNWVSILCEIFDNAPPTLGVIGPKQLRVDRIIHAFGDFILHPNGYTHLAHGFQRDAIRHAVEVDHVMGCFYCCKKEVYDALDGYDENYLRGQTIDFGLRARLEGWSCWAVPEIEYIHAHKERVNRATNADTNRGIDKSLKVFEDKWGFSRIAPDLSVVAKKYAGTPLLWNARIFGGNPFSNLSSMWNRAYPKPPAMRDFNQTQWIHYTSNEQYRDFITFRVAVPLELAKKIGDLGRVAHLASGDGIIGHLLAQQGIEYIGIDPHKSRVDLANETVKAQGNYENNNKPEYLHMPDASHIPLEDESVDLFYISDQMECHPNPVGLLKEARRVLTPEGRLVIVGGRTNQIEPPHESDCHWFHWTELINLVMAVGGFGLNIDRDGDDESRDMILIASRYDRESLEQETIPQASHECNLV